MRVPYEYGRVKEPVVHLPQAATWLHPNFARAITAGNRTLPEYMLLAAQCANRAEVHGWFARKLAAWRRSFPWCPQGARDPLPPAPGDLPESDDS
jgi:hypothetical protein